MLRHCTSPEAGVGGGATEIMQMDVRARLLQENLNQAERRIQNAVCPIYGLDDRDRPQLIGSSILLRVSIHSFLITAAHVLDANNRTTLYVGGPAELVQLAGSSYRVKPPTSGRKDDSLDFGFVDISDTPQNGGHDTDS
jgi:hypothetical protein